MLAQEITFGSDPLRKIVIVDADCLLPRVVRLYNVIAQCSETTTHSTKARTELHSRGVPERKVGTKSCCRPLNAFWPRSSQSPPPDKSDSSLQ